MPDSIDWLYYGDRGSFNEVWNACNGALYLSGFGVISYLRYVEFLTVVDGFSDKQRSAKLLSKFRFIPPCAIRSTAFGFLTWRHPRAAECGIVLMHSKPVTKST